MGGANSATYQENLQRIGIFKSSKTTNTVALFGIFSLLWISDDCLKNFNTKILLQIESYQSEPLWNKLSQSLNENVKLYTGNCRICHHFWPLWRIMIPTQRSKSIIFQLFLERLLEDFRFAVVGEQAFEKLCVMMDNMKWLLSRSRVGGMQVGSRRKNCMLGPQWKPQGSSFTKSPLNLVIAYHRKLRWFTNFTSPTFLERNKIR